MIRTLGVFGYIDGDDYNDVKLNEDRYEVYVNGDFIGYKTLYGLNEEVSDVEDFLYEHGIKQYHTKLEGDHYLIETDDDHDLKEILSVYLEPH